MRSSGESGRRSVRLATAALALALAAAPAFADGRDDQIEELQKQLQEFRDEQDRMRAEIEQLRKEADRGPGDLEAAVADVIARMDREGLDGGLAVRTKSKRLDIGGYFSTRYTSSEQRGKNGSFVDMRLVPMVHAEISENIHFDSEVEIEHAGTGGSADGEIVVEKAELSFVFAPEFVLKAGTLLVPFGHFNLNHDDPMNELSERPRVARYVVPSAFALPGVGAEGELDLGAGMLTYDVALTNGFRDEFDSEKGSRNARGLFEEDDNHDKTFFGRIAFVPTETLIDALSIGASGARGRLGSDGRGEHRLTGYGFDLQAKEGPWEAMFEYDKFSIDRASGTAPPVAPNGEIGPVRGLDGYYAQLLYRLREPWLAALPFADDNASMAFVVRRDKVDTNDRVRGAAPQDDERSLTLGINYRPTSKTVIKLEYRWSESGFDGKEGSDRDFFAVEFATYF